MKLKLKYCVDCDKLVLGTCNPKHRIIEITDPSQPVSILIFTDRVVINVETPSLKPNFDVTYDRVPGTLVEMYHVDFNVIGYVKIFYFAMDYSTMKECVRRYKAFGHIRGNTHACMWSPMYRKVVLLRRILENWDDLEFEKFDELESEVMG